MSIKYKKIRKGSKTEDFSNTINYQLMYGRLLLCKEENLESPKYNVNSLNKRGKNPEAKLATFYFKNLLNSIQ